MNTSKRIIRILFLNVIFAMTFSLIACNPQKRQEKFTITLFEYFDTVTTVIGYEENQEQFNKTSELIEERLSEYHRLYDVYNEYEGLNNLKSLNGLNNGAHPELEVDEKIIDLLLYAKNVYSLTEGKTNVAMGSVLTIWHKARDKAQDNPSLAVLPSHEQLQEAAEHTDINSIIINEEDSTVFISDPEAVIDVGAIAKGYAVEMIARELEAMGKSSYAISAGGNVRVIGEKPDSQKWVTGIENPISDSEQPCSAMLSVADKAVVTSGSYQRFFTYGEKNYHHIIDAETLYPSEYFASVTVIADDSALADALSTALFCMSLEQGMALVESMEAVDALWIFANGEKALSSGFSAYLSE